MFLKFTNIPCAVSGRKYEIDDSSSIAPILVLNIILNCCSLSQSFELHSGQFLRTQASPLSKPELAIRSPTSSVRNVFLHFLHVTFGSANPLVCPLACQTRAFIRIAVSTQYMSSLSVTNFFHHRFLILDRK